MESFSGEILCSGLQPNLIATDLVQIILNCVLNRTQKHVEPTTIRNEAS